MTIDTAPEPSPGSPPPPAAEAWLQVSAVLGDLTRTMDGMRREQLQRAARGIMHPSVAAGVVAADGTLVLDLGGPAQGRQWALRRLLVTDASNSLAAGGGTPTANSGTLAPAAAGSIALPAGASITGWDVTVLPAAAVVSGLVTVTGLAVANQNYELTETTTGTTLSVRYPGPLAPASPAATPQVNVPAITGGAGYAIAVYGTTAVTGAVAGTASLHAAPAPLFSPVNELWTLKSLPDRARFTSESIICQSPERLFLRIAGGTAGQSITARADVLDYPLGFPDEVLSL